MFARWVGWLRWRWKELQKLRRWWRKPFGVWRNPVVHLYIHAIKKYVSPNYNVDAETLSPSIKEYLKVAVTSDRLLQPTGRGARGSFKLATMNSAIFAGATAQDRGGCRWASGPNRKKGRKQPTAKNTRLKSKLAVKTPKKSPSQAKKLAKVPSKKPKARRSRRATMKYGLLTKVTFWKKQNKIKRPFSGPRIYKKKE